MTIYHLIGIGGIGMSALARILVQQGHQVQGTDQKDSALIQELKRENILVHIGHLASYVDGAEIVAYSSDIPQNHPEILRAKDLSKPLLHRSELLNFCMQRQKPLLVTGTHGKTTTTSLLSHVLVKAHLDPSFVIGGVLLDSRTNAYFGKGEFFVAEADESDGSFLKTKSFGAIVTNLENDHLSYWKTPDALDRGFNQFFLAVQNPAHLFWCQDDPRLSSLNPPGLSYGFSQNASARLQNFSQTEKGIVFDLFFQNYLYKGIEVSLFGKHNALNAAAVFCLALSLQAKEPLIREALQTFKGVHRRLEWKKEVKTIQLFDDYGHHPTEIQATLSALRQKISSKRLVVVFQPHRYTRVQELLEEFCLCFNDADLVILTDIYSAGEKPIENLFSTLLHHLQKHLGPKLHFLSKHNLEQEAAKLLAPNDVLLTIGAGDITFAGEGILECV